MYQLYSCRTAQEEKTENVLLSVHCDAFLANNFDSERLNVIDNNITTKLWSFATDLMEN